MAWNSRYPETSWQVFGSSSPSTSSFLTSQARPKTAAARSSGVRYSYLTGPGYPYTGSSYSDTDRYYVTRHSPSHDVKPPHRQSNPRSSSSVATRDVSTHPSSFDFTSVRKTEGHDDATVRGTNHHYTRSKTSHDVTARDSINDVTSVYPRTDHDVTKRPRTSHRSESPTKTRGRETVKSTAVTRGKSEVRVRQSAVDLDLQSPSYDDDYGVKYQTGRRPKTSYGHHQKQSAVELQRSLQASAQMAYDVFGNVITALEEYESRESERKGYGAPRKSRIKIADQSFKDYGDVKACLEAQLRVIELHMKFCRKEVAVQILPEMRKMVADWLAARSDVPVIDSHVTKTDHYAVNLFEILAKGSTKHKDLKPQKLGKDELVHNFSKICVGLHQADHLDARFANDPRLTADKPDVRKGSDTYCGIERILQIKPGLETYTDDIEAEGYGAR